MKTFQTFIELEYSCCFSEDVALEQRNKAIDLQSIVKDILNKKNVTDPKAYEDIYNYLAVRKTFSLGKMSDEFSYSVGVMKAIIEAVKAAIDEKGYGKKGSDVSGPLSQAGRIDRYLKDVHKSSRLK